MFEVIEQGERLIERRWRETRAQTIANSRGADR
jgi:hypothetical protein